jgi:hypothetical protein
MIVDLTHPQLGFIDQYKVFDSVSTVKSLCDGIYKASLLIPLIKVDPDGDRSPYDKQRKFRGDAFEIFGEYLCRVTETDTRIGVRAGKLVPLDEDVGVDLYGESTMGDGPVSVQFKFKSDPLYMFTLRELATWLAASGHIINASGRNLILITTGQSVNYRVRQVVPSLRVIGRNHLRDLVDNNSGFWQDFLVSVENSKRKPLTRTKRVLYADQEGALSEIDKWLDGDVL